MKSKRGSQTKSLKALTQEIVETHKGKKAMNRYRAVAETRRFIFRILTFEGIEKWCCNYRAVAALLACTAFILFEGAFPVYGQGEVGLFVGISRDSGSGKPMADVQILARNMEKGTDNVTLSDAGGIFTLTNLEPGQYEIIATKDGFHKLSVRVELHCRGTVRLDLPMQIMNDSTRSIERSDNDRLTEREKQLLARIDRLEVRLAAMEAKNNVQTPADARTNPGAEPLPASLKPLALVTPASASTQSALPLNPAAVPASAPAATPAAALPVVPEALQKPEPTPGVDNTTPFAYGDFTWLNGNPRNKTPVFDTKFFTPDIRFDTHFMVDFNQPKDHTLGGSTESFRSSEFHVEQISVGGDFHWQNVRGRILTMFGLFATTTPRNDASAGVGQWDTRDAYRYVSEAYGGYHFNVNHGLNVDAGIFVSYIGLFSYYNFDNWAYQPSFVSSNTPWFFNGLRIQWFPTNKLKIEPWIINGWQSYNRFNGHHGLGGQILYRPKEWLSLVFNNYGNGTDTLGNPDRTRLHTDDSIQVRYFNKPESSGVSKMAFTLTGDAGCEYGGGVSCHGGQGGPKQSFLGWMAYNRTWFHKDLLALTVGGGKMNNPGRYLTLLPPINGADAVSGSPYFTENPGDKAHMWDSSINLQWMPKQYITFWVEGVYRHSDVPYWSGRGGITPPGGNNGSPGQFVCSNGTASGTSDLATAYANCGGPGTVWFPDLRKSQTTFSAGILVKF